MSSKQLARHLRGTMNPRYKALEISGKRTRQLLANGIPAPNPSEIFGIHVFNRIAMQKMLPHDIFKNVLNAIEGLEKIKPEFADTIALAMKDWAIGLGATHYTHWFQPLTGAAAEKHDAFIDWNAPDRMIEKFNGKQLIQGEPDASSFPSGGLRSTYEARGYTGWDPTSPAFVWTGGDGVTLCIPSIFFSWTGDVLDSKIPLLRSDKKINDAVMRLLKLTGIPAHYINSTLGCEQEYFIIDRAWRNLRPDLVMAGRTVFGVHPPKGQELQDHYFGSVKDRILDFMRDFEEAALKLAIPVKTRHNEVAPAQHEVAPVFERLSSAIDHNILLMELMRQIAVKHDLSCLLHEKPFQGLNGSGKHCNWSLATDTGINLLNPTDTPENNLHFLILLTAILNAVYEHSALLRAAIGSSSNDYRLGGHEAPPAIISVYLGNELEAVLESIEKKGNHKRETIKSNYELGIPVTPDLTRDNTDRNRTSPFAFTGNKFEFRAVGSSANPAFPMTVLNAIVAESLNQMIDEIEVLLEKRTPISKKILFEAAIPVVRKYLRSSRRIRFAGDNYSEEWSKEAKQRNLPNIQKSIDAFEALKTKKTIHAFQGILTSQELHSRYEILAETYSHHVNIETNLMIDIFRTQVLPAAIKQQKELAASIAAYSAAIGAGKKLPQQVAYLKDLSQNIEKAIKIADELEAARQKAIQISVLETRGKAFCYKILPKCEELRNVVDKLEMQIDDMIWPLPKYRELLFLM
jgi:glutamine synthetase